MRKERSCALTTQSKRLQIRITRAQTSQVTDPRIRRCYFSPSPLTYTLRVYLTSHPSALSCCLKPSKAQKWKRAEEQTQSKAPSALQEYRTLQSDFSLLKQVLKIHHISQMLFHNFNPICKNGDFLF